MLSACQAILFGRTPIQEKFLRSLAQRCGFGHIGGFGDVTENVAPINFILVHYLLGDELLSGILRAIRSSDSLLRFSPVILIADDCPFERVLAYIELGLDDVISLPENREEIIQRLATQLDTEHTYFETLDYFGPDRRRMRADAGDDRRKGTAGHSRYRFRRDVSCGIEIIDHEVYAIAHFEATPRWSPLEQSGLIHS